MSLQRQRAVEKIEGWLEGVGEDAFLSALEALVSQKRAAGEYRFKNDDEVAIAKRHARGFFREFARKIVELSDGRCVYFAPDPRARLRNSNNAVSWAEYAFHAVSNGGSRVYGKNYNERWYNPYKATGFSILEKTLKAERCLVRLNVKNPRFDAIMFDGGMLVGIRYRIVTRLDEYGNMDANLTEVTFEASSKKEKKSPRLVPLVEAVQAVVHHQATAGSYPKDAVIVPNFESESKGVRCLIRVRRI